MAKNYTFSEAVGIIANGTDLESVADIGRRYPVLATKVATVAAKAGDSFIDLMNYMPDYLTANKVNSAIKAGIVPTSTDETEVEAEDAETTKENETSTEAEDAKTVEWNESMSAKQLWDLLGKAGKRKVAKSTKKVDLIEACKEVFGTANAEADEPAEENAETEENATPYDGKSAVELFKECKARKLKVAPKKPAKFYVDLLVKDDAEKAAAKTEEADDDDWSDDEPAEKPAKKEEKKPAKPAKKAEPESDDEDDDWDI